MNMTLLHALRVVLVALAALTSPLGATAQSLDPGRTAIMKGLADPDILADGDRFLLTGSWTAGNYKSVKIWSSPTLERFKEIVDYSPSRADPEHDYCRIWAPEIARVGSGYQLSFSASQFDEGGKCPCLYCDASDLGVTTFIATAPDKALRFGRPKPINAGSTLPRSLPTRACPPEGCNHAIRIDATRYDTPSGDWLFYTWFDRGNHISGFNLDRPGAPRDVARPLTHYENPLRDYPYEERVNEAPDVFSRAGLTYLIYSRGHTQRAYGLSYLISDQRLAFDKTRGIHSLSTPVFAERGPGCDRVKGNRPYNNGTVVENMGHSAVVEHRGRYFIFYHRGFWPDGACEGPQRDTFRQELRFRPDGTIESLTDLFLLWPDRPGHSYSLDVQLKDGSWIAPCVGAGILGQTASYRFTGVCASARTNRIVHKSDIATVRLVSSADGNWSDGRGETARAYAYDGTEVLVMGSTGRVALTWTGTGRPQESYALHLMLRNGTAIRNCANQQALGDTHAFLFNGTCPSRPGAGRIDPKTIREYRFCATSSWRNLLRESEICIRKPVTGAPARIHADFGGA